MVWYFEMTSIQQHYFWRERRSNAITWETLSRFDHGHGAGISLGSAQHSPGPGIAYGLAWSKRSHRSDDISTSCASFHQKLLVSTAYKVSIQYRNVTMYTLFWSMLWIIIKVNENFYPAAVTFQWISFTSPHQLQLRGNGRCASTTTSTTAQSV